MSPVGRVCIRIVFGVGGNIRRDGAVLAGLAIDRWGAAVVVYQRSGREALTRVEMRYALCVMRSGVIVGKRVEGPNVDRDMGGEADVPVTLPYDPDSARGVIAEITAMERRQYVSIRPNPTILDNYFGITDSRPIGVRWLERQHIFSDRILNANPELLIHTLFNPREIVENRKGETRRKRLRRRALFYGSVNEKYDLAVVVEFMQDGRSHYIVSAFAPTKARTAVRQSNEPAIWKH